MTVLGIDTATWVTTAGVVRDGTLAAEAAERSSAGHASRLPALVERTLVEAGVSISDLDAVAVSIGPGSFTGMRVGIGFAKGLCYAARKPLLGVPTLPALAAGAPPEVSYVAACLDARRGEVYCQVFRRESDRLEVLGEATAAEPATAAAAIVSLFAGRGGVVIGDAAERYAESFAELARHGIALLPFSDFHPRGGRIAAAAVSRLGSGVADRQEALAPLYVKASGARAGGPSFALTSEK